MPKLSLAILASLFLSASPVLSGCAMAGSGQTDMPSVAAAETTLVLEKGEILQFILVSSKPGDVARAVRAEYFRDVIPVAGSLGAETQTFLPITDTLVGDDKPDGISVFTFPDQAAQDSFRRHPDWESFKQMRRDAWSQLDVLSVELQDDVRLRFDPTKSYTIAVAWTRPGTIADYQRYLDGIEADFEQIGARYVAQLNGVERQTLDESDGIGNPSQLTLVEWSDGPNLRGLQQSEAYKAHVGDFETSITRFDLYAFEAPKT